MERREIPPLEPGKVFRGGYNPNPPRTTPDFVPAPFGPPPPAPPPWVEPVRRKLADPSRQVVERKPTLPLEPGKVFRGGYNPNPPRTIPDFVPPPFGPPPSAPPPWVEPARRTSADPK